VAHAIDRAYRIMDALACTAMPVPRMLHYTTDAAIVGRLGNASSSDAERVGAMGPVLSDKAWELVS
jgi:hypothetical protein